MNEKIEYATNAELQKMLIEVEKKYEEAKIALKNCYDDMINASIEYNNIKYILNKRGIK